MEAGAKKTQRFLQVFSLERPTEKAKVHLLLFE
jgi:hypothetical protein